MRPESLPPEQVKPLGIGIALSMFCKQVTLAGVPVLMWGQGQPYRGTVFLYHGLGASKETNEKELRILASQGFLAVGVDAVGHGERRFPDFEERMQGEDSHSQFLGMVRQSADELPFLWQKLRASSGGLGPLGVCGISMGGCITFAAACNSGVVKAAAPILGSPDWSLGGMRPVNGDWWKDSPHHTPEWFPPVALLVQNAGQDVNVPPEPAREFVKDASRYYGPDQDRLRYFEYADSDHFMNPLDWEILWARVVGWFERYL